MDTLKIKIIAAFSLIFWTLQAGAADIEIRMLDKSDTGGMLVFEPGFVKASVNDTLVFVPTTKGHNSSSVLVPSGAKEWKGPYDKEFRVKLEHEGIFLYACDAHKPMGMVGVVQVGKAVNLEEARKKAAEASAAMVMNKDRFAKQLEQVQ
jgi:pseudoazurin